MLYKQTIESATLALLKSLQAISELSKLRLVGGTALALQIGHRKSIGIDLFGKFVFEHENILPELNKIGQVQIIRSQKNINVFLIDNIKVDIVNYYYPWIEKGIVEDEILFADKKDIAAMKLAAITGRGTKKDFIDLYYLLKEFTLRQMLDFYNMKYTDGSEFLVLKSLTYFVDAENDVMPVMLNDVNWEHIKDKIVESVDSLLIR